MELLEKIVRGTKKSAKKLGLVAALTTSSILGSGCGGGHNKNSEHYLTPQEIELTSRLVETQLADGGWSQSQIWYNPIDYSVQGAQGITGATALGLFDAHKVDLYDGKDSNTALVPETLRRTKDFLYEKMEDLNNNFTAMVNPINFVFMKKYDEKFGLNQEEKDSVEAAWDKLLWRWDMISGTDPTVMADGLFNKINQGLTMQGREALMGTYGSQIFRGAIAMNESPTEISWIQNQLRNSPIDPEIEGGLSSIARTLYALNEAGDTSMNVPLLDALNSKRNADGSYGPNPESSVQTTASALRALKEIGSSDAIDTHRWLQNQIKEGGYVYDPVTEEENTVANGLILQSLLMNRKP